VLSPPAPRLDFQSSRVRHRLQWNLTLVALARRADITDRKSLIQRIFIQEQPCTFLLTIPATDVPFAGLSMDRVQSSTTTCSTGRPIVHARNAILTTLPLPVEKEPHTSHRSICSATDYCRAALSGADSDMKLSRGRETASGEHVESSMISGVMPNNFWLHPQRLCCGSKRCASTPMRGLKWPGENMLMLT